jgi:hypothetical protein
MKLTAPRCRRFYFVLVFHGFFRVVDAVKAFEFSKRLFSKRV